MDILTGEDIKTLTDAMEVCKHINILCIARIDPKDNFSSFPLGTISERAIHLRNDIERLIAGCSMRLDDTQANEWMRERERECEEKFDL